MFDESPFKEIVRNHIKKGWSILDLGAGDCSFGQELTNRGAKVICVSNDTPQELPPSIEFKKFDILNVQKFHKTEHDAILLLNVIHLLPNEFVIKTLFPECFKRLKKKGYLFMETLSADTEPNFGILYNHFYKDEDFKEIHHALLYSALVSYVGRGIHAEEHKWHSLQKIWIKS